jgi:hypothetical protein
MDRDEDCDRNLVTLAGYYRPTDIDEPDQGWIEPASEKNKRIII